MTMIAVVGLAMLLAIVPRTVQPQPEGGTVQTWTGWFSDKRCARAPAADHAVRPNGSECVKRCLDEGSTPVFLSEQANDIFEVRNHPAVRDDVGYRVEVVAAVDTSSKIISIQSVKRLSEVTAMCLLPKKKSAG